MNPLPRRGLYAITPELDRVENLERLVEAALRGGACMVQFRDKSSHRTAREKTARALQRLCNQFKAPLIINDDVPLAATINADGVHLGQDDISLSTARALLGDRCLIGVSCYNDSERALMAAKEGANYVAYGSFFPSPTKPNALRANLSLVRETRAKLSVPLVGIGGITPENASPLIAAGIDLLAVITAVFDTPDPTGASRRFVELFNQPAIDLFPNS